MHWELNGLTETNLGCNSGDNIFPEMRFTPDNNKSEKPFFLVSFNQNPKTFFYIYFSRKKDK